MILLLVNVVLALVIVYINRSQQMALSNLSLLWVPLGLFFVWVIPTISTTWANVNNSSVPFPIVFMSATVLPSQGLFNAVLFAVRRFCSSSSFFLFHFNCHLIVDFQFLLGREKKTVQQTVTRIHTDDDSDVDPFHTDGENNEICIFLCLFSFLININNHRS